MSDHSSSAGSPAQSERAPERAYDRAQSLGGSFRAAGTGLVHALRTQRNTRIHAAATGLVFLAGLSTRLSPGEWALITLTVGFVWMAELINTAVEATVDRISVEPHELARVAKDTAAGAVLIAAVCSVIVGAIVFGSRLWN